MGKGIGASGLEHRRRSRGWEDNLRAAGGLGMSVFFGTLVLNGNDVDRAPAWAMWPAATLMLVGVTGGLVIHLYRRHTGKGRD
jgi:hypothetical protein